MKNLDNIIKLEEYLLHCLQFNEIDPSAITNIEYNLGTIWFEHNGNIYSISILKCEE